MAEHVARAGKSKAKHLSQEISVALRERRWAEAATLLAELSRTSASNVKLGSLQRWTRDADACVDDDKAQWRALLWLLCRVAAGEAADAPTGDVPLRRSVFAALPRAEAADPTPACATTAKPAYVCAREKAAQRTPPNKFDLTIWAQTESVLDGAAQATRVDVPAVPGAFLVRDVFSPTESGRLLALASTLGYERDEPLDAAARSRRGEDNPKQKGTACRDRYEKYKSATTVKEFYEKEGTPADLDHDIGKGFIEVIQPTPAPSIQPTPAPSIAGDPDRKKRSREGPPAPRWSSDEEARLRQVVEDERRAIAGGAPKTGVWDRVAIALGTNRTGGAVSQHWSAMNRGAVTGAPAKFFDPVTQAPYATLEAFRTLRGRTGGRRSGAA